MLCKRKRYVFACLMWSTFAIPAIAQDVESGVSVEKGAATATDNSSTASDANPNPVATNVIDLAFDRYVDLKLLATAVEEADAATLTDLALQAAFGESVLERSHKAVTSKQLASLALKVALDTKDDKSMDRLVKLAEKSRDDDLKAKISMQRKLGSASRSAPAVMVAMDQISVDGLKNFKDYLADIELAVRLGDRWKLDEIQKADLSALPEELRKKIVDLVKAADAKLSEDGDELAKLVGISRECSRNQPPPATTGGYGPPPTTTTGGYGPPPTTGGYGPPPTTGGYGPPPTTTGGYGPPPTTTGGYGPPPKTTGGYGPPPTTTGGYGPPPTTTGGYGPPPTTTGGYGPPPTTTGGYGPPPTTTGGYGPPPTTTGGYGPPPTTTGGYGPPPTTGGYGPPPTTTGGYGPPPTTGGNAPPQQPNQPFTEGRTQGEGQNLRNVVGATSQIVGAISQLRGASRGGEGGYGPPTTTTTGGYGTPITATGGYGQPGQANAYGPTTTGVGYQQPGQQAAYGPQAAGGGYGQAGGGYGQTVLKYQRGPAYASGSLTGTFEQSGPGAWIERNCKGVHQIREVSRNSSILVLERTGAQAGQRYRIDLARNEIVDSAEPNISYKIIPPVTAPGAGGGGYVPTGAGVPPQQYDPRTTQPLQPQQPTVIIPGPGAGEARGEDFSSR
jgi:hypothetical protein